MKNSYIVGRFAAIFKSSNVSDADPLIPDALNEASKCREIEAALTRSKAWNELQHAESIIKELILTENDTRTTVKFYRMSGGMTNDCYRLETQKGSYFLRIPGKGSEDHLSRSDEAFNVGVTQTLALNAKNFIFDEKTGFSVSEFLQDATPLSRSDLRSKKTIHDVANKMKNLHKSGRNFKNDIPIFKRLVNLIIKLGECNHKLMYDKDDLLHRLMMLKRICCQDRSPLVACHNDPTYTNFVYCKGELMWLDWEYSGNNRALYDLANFAYTSNLTKEAKQCLLQAYYGKSPTKQLWQVFSANEQLTALWYYLWAEVQLANHSNVVPKDELITMAQKHWNAVMCQDIQLPKPRTSPIDFEKFNPGTTKIRKGI